MKIDIEDVKKAIEYVKKHSNNTSVTVGHGVGKIILTAMDRGGNIINIELFDTESKMKAKVTSTEIL